MSLLKKVTFHLVLQIRLVKCKDISSDSIEVSKLRSTQMVHCDRKFEKFDKILIREASSALIPCISSFFLQFFLMVFERWYELN